MGCLSTSVTLLVGAGGGTHAEATQAVLGVLRLGQAVTTGPSSRRVWLWVSRG